MRQFRDNPLGVKSLLAMPRTAKRLLAVSVDAGLCVMTVWFAFYLRLGEFIPLAGDPMKAVFVSLIFALPVFVVFGLYRAIFRYSGWPVLMTIAKASAVYGVLFSILFTVISIQGIPRTVGLIQPMLLLVSVGASRAFIHFWLGGAYRRRFGLSLLPKVLIYGAGNAGRQLANAMSNSNEMRVLGFLDDAKPLQGQLLNGLPIHDPAALPSLKSVLGITHVLLAIPSASRRRRNEILGRMLAAKVAVRTLPSVSDLAQGKISTSDLRELDIDDLLGRSPVPPDPILLNKNIADRVVLVSGAGGSIGSELCRQILNAKPNTLLLVEQNEFALYKIHYELQAKIKRDDLSLAAQHANELVAAEERPPMDSTRILPLLASVYDEKRMRKIMATWRPHTIYHAAAYKHVPMVEHNPIEGIRNNVLGTLSIARAAIDHEVTNFVLISTDKAVRPTNIMGASKRLAEMVLQALAETPSRTQFSMVRFGNVLDSSGSVVPLFREQIKQGGPITLTHPDITRYFMTIPEAAQLVIQAGAMGARGDVFVLDMGEPVKIMDLAVRMIELSGLSVRDEENPHGDIEIAITGLRPGEKLYEELLIGNDPKATPNPRIMKARENFLAWNLLEEQMHRLQRLLDEHDMDDLRNMLQQLVSGYQPGGGIVDWVYLAQNRSELNLRH